jgi:uncharacterized protein (TIGR02271 family)
MLSDEQIRGLIGGTAVDQNGDKIGKIGMVYFDDQTGKADWITVNTGFFGSSESFVPLASATVEGDTVRVPYTKDKIKDAPKVDADQHLDEPDERRLYSHYGLDYAGAMTGTGDDREPVGHDTSGPTTDNAITRSEEQLSVGKESREAGRARLRKYVATEEQTVNVPVSREEVRVEREPITEGNVDRATSGPAISEEEHEVVLHEERPVVEKEAKPVERVRLDKDTVTDQQQVSEEVRKEEIEAEGADVRDRADADRRR